MARRPDLGLHLTPDLEEQRQARYTKENDPYRLSAGLKTATEMKGIELSAGDGRFPIAIVGPGRRKARKIQEFYYSQNANIERLLKPVDEHRSQARDDHSGNQVKYKIAVHGSFVVNVILAGLQVFAAASSGSLSLFTTMADAIFDPLSNLTLILSHRAVNSVDARKFPSGKARIETAGNIVFCFIMCSMSFIIIVLAARELMAGSKHETREFHPGSVAAVAIALVTKMVLFAYCWTLRNTYSQIRILWQDHRNDIFVNAFGLMTSVGGSKLRWWIDPTGAIVLSCVVALIWLRTAYSEFQLLIGVTASLELQQLITYICAYSIPFLQSTTALVRLRCASTTTDHAVVLYNSGDALSAYIPDRYRPGVLQRPSHHRRSRCCHGSRRDASGDTRRRRGASEQARESA